MTFQVTDVTKPLASVARITERGNIVQFGPKAEDNFILSISTKRKIPFERRGGTCVMDVEYMMDGNAASGFPRQDSA